MPTITLKNVPDELHRRLKERAARNDRSLNREAIRCLEAAIAEPADDTDLQGRIRRFREGLAARGAWATPESIEQAIEEGRA